MFASPREDRSRFREEDFSVDSSLLQELPPMHIADEPVIIHCERPQIRLLSQANIRAKKYGQLLEECVEKLQIEQRNRRLQSVKMAAKIGLQTSRSHSAKHKINNKPTIDSSPKHNISKPRDKKIELLPISQRITKYKEKEKDKTDQKLKMTVEEKEAKSKTMAEMQAKVADNAKKILAEKKRLKEQEDQQIRITNAKIRAIELKSKEKVSHCKKKQFVPTQSFEVGHQQELTSAQDMGKNTKANIQVKKKSDDQTKQQMKLQNIKSTNQLIEAGKVKKNGQQKRRRVFKQVNKKQDNVENLVQKSGKFYMWDVPIGVDDIARFIGQQEVQKWQKNIAKVTKTFKEQAAQLISQRNYQRAMQERQEARQFTFEDRVRQKKKQIMQEYKTYQQPCCWNEDVLFRTGKHENFHYYASTSQC